LIRMLYYNYRRRSRSPDENWNNVETFLSRLELAETSVLSLNWDCVIEQGLERTRGVDNFEYGCDARPAFFTSTNDVVLRARLQTKSLTRRRERWAASAAPAEGAVGAAAQESSGGGRLQRA
jgi:hypothetical protein